VLTGWLATAGDLTTEKSGSSVCGYIQLAASMYYEYISRTRVHVVNDVSIKLPRGCVLFV